ncbi:MAG: sigma-70 family RNA polymerase sigma factor [Clostridiales bacterium]|nr:sigma-70 family RNA polymerase sigma factor [Clostridiales bacterium]
MIKGVSTYRPDKGVRLATYASRCIENEILMFFRSSRKSAGDVSLSDTIETDGDGNSLSLMDILCAEDDMLDSISARESCSQLRRCVETTLTRREADIITLRYGLSGKPPQPQREVAKLFDISRSYVSRIEKRALEKLKLELEKQ